MLAQQPPKKQRPRQKSGKAPTDNEVNLLTALLRDDLLVTIAGILPARDLGRLGCVCRRFSARSISAAAQHCSSLSAAATAEDRGPSQVLWLGARSIVDEAARLGLGREPPLVQEWARTQIIPWYKCGVPWLKILWLAQTAPFHWSFTGTGPAKQGAHPLHIRGGGTHTVALDERLHSFRPALGARLLQVPRAGSDSSGGTAAPQATGAVAGAVCVASSHFWLLTVSWSAGHERCVRRGGPSGSGRTALPGAHIVGPSTTLGGGFTGQPG